MGRAFSAGVGMSALRTFAVAGLGFAGGVGFCFAIGAAYNVGHRDGLKNRSDCVEGNRQRIKEPGDRDVKSVGVRPEHVDLSLKVARVRELLEGVTLLTHQIAGSLRATQGSSDRPDGFSKVHDGPQSSVAPTSLSASATSPAAGTASTPEGNGAAGTPLPAAPTSP